MPITYTPTKYLKSMYFDGEAYALSHGLYGECSTAAATAAKTVSIPGFDSLSTGVTIKVKFTNSNTAANPTLAVNSTSAKPLCKYGTTRAGTTNRTSWNAGSIVSLTYDGTSWIIDSHIDDTGDTNSDTKVTQTATTTSNDYPILLKNTTATSTVTDTARFGSTSGKVPTINPATGNLKIFSVNNVMIDVENTTGVVIQNQNTGGKTYHLNDAASKAVDTSITNGSTSTNLPTSQAVAAFVASQVAGFLQYQGTISDVVTTGFSEGDYWIASGSFTIPATTGTGAKPAIVVEAGDMIIANQDVASGTSMNAGNVDAVQTNIETLTTTEIDSLWAAA